MDDILNFKYHQGSHSDDFYYKFSSNGRKLYYSKLTGKTVAKDYIRPKLIPDIKLKEDISNANELIKTKDIYLKQIEDLQKKIAELFMVIDMTMSMNRY